MKSRLFELLLRCALGAGLLFAYSSMQAQDNIQLLRHDGAYTPANVFLPEQECQGVAIISHGAGGSETGYHYLAKPLSKAGYLSIVPGHQESGMKALRQHMKGKQLFRGLEQGLEALVTDKAAYLDRFLDIQAALLWAQNQCKNPARYLIGHSMGAATVMLEAGAKNKLGLNTPPEKFDAYIALSPQGVGNIFPQHAWQEIQSPVLIMTGTQDKELGNLPWQTRTESFADMPNGCKWLGIIDGATHMSFAGRGHGKQEESLIVNTVLSFMKASKDQTCVLPASTAGLELKSKY